MNHYTFYWLDGTREVLKGKSASDAYKRAGYGAGAFSALDFMVNGVDNNYEWKDAHWTRKVT